LVSAKREKYHSEMATIPKVGSRIHFTLYAGREVDGVIRAILQTTSGVRYRVDYGNGPYVATINPEQIIRPPEIKGADNVDL
jgi:hypothetical protein